MNRGRPSNYLLPAVENRENDLKVMNKGKVGRPYQYSNVEIFAAFAIKCIFKLGYREASGIVEDYERQYGAENTPNFRTIQWRIKKLRKDTILLSIHEESKDMVDIEVIIDSTGIKSRNDGEYRSTKYGKVKDWEKMHVVVDKKTHKILNIIITDSSTGDAKEFIPLLKLIEHVKTAVGDGAYDSEDNFKHCDEKGIISLVPVRINSVGISPHRKLRVEEQLGVIRRRGRNRNIIPPEEMRIKNQEKWKSESGYHMRSIVEGVFSVFKNTFGEYTFSKTKEMKEKELMLKALIYNKYIA